MCNYVWLQFDVIGAEAVLGTKSAPSSGRMFVKSVRELPLVTGRLMRNLFRNKWLFFPFNLQVFTQAKKWAHGVKKLSGIAMSPFHTDETKGLKVKAAQSLSS